MADDLVQRLRLRAQPWRGGLHMPDKIVEVVEAADRIEELEAAHRARYDETVVQKHRISKLEARIKKLETRILELQKRRAP